MSEQAWGEHGLIDSDPLGNLCVANNISGTAGRLQITRVNSNGTIDWSTFYDEPHGDSLQPTAIRFDSSGNVYVAGIARWYQSESQITAKQFLVKAAPGGQIEWAIGWDSDPNAIPPTKIEFDRSGQVVVISIPNEYHYDNFLRHRFFWAREIQSTPIGVGGMIVTLTSQGIVTQRYDLWKDFSIASLSLVKTSSDEVAWLADICHSGDDCRPTMAVAYYSLSLNEQIIKGVQKNFRVATANTIPSRRETHYAAISPDHTYIIDPTPVPGGGFFLNLARHSAFDGVVWSRPLTPDMTGLPSPGVFPLHHSRLATMLVVDDVSVHALVSFPDGASTRVCIFTFSHDGTLLANPLVESGLDIPFDFETVQTPYQGDRAPYLFQSDGVGGYYFGGLTPASGYVFRRYLPGVGELWRLTGATGDPSGLHAMADGSIVYTTKQADSHYLVRTFAQQHVDDDIQTPTANSPWSFGLHKHDEETRNLIVAEPRDGNWSINELELVSPISNPKDTTLFRVPAGSGPGIAFVLDNTERISTTWDWVARYSRASAGALAIGGSLTYESANDRKGNILSDNVPYFEMRVSRATGSNYVVLASNQTSSSDLPANLSRTSVEISQTVQIDPSDVIEIVVRNLAPNSNGRLVERKPSSNVLDFVRANISISPTALPTVPIPEFSQVNPGMLQISVGITNSLPTGNIDGPIPNSLAIRRVDLLADGLAIKSEYAPQEQQTRFLIDTNRYAKATLQVRTVNALGQSTRSSAFTSQGLSVPALVTLNTSDIKAELIRSLYVQEIKSGMNTPQGIANAIWGKFVANMIRSNAPFSGTHYAEMSKLAQNALETNATLVRLTQVITGDQNPQFPATSRARPAGTGQLDQLSNFVEANVPEETQIFAYEYLKVLYNIVTSFEAGDFKDGAAGARVKILKALPKEGLRLCKDYSGNNFGLNMKLCG